MEADNFSDYIGPAVPLVTWWLLIQNIHVTMIFMNKGHRIEGWCLGPPEKQKKGKEGEMMSIQL